VVLGKQSVAEAGKECSMFKCQCSLTSRVLLKISQRYLLKKYRVRDCGQLLD